MPRDLEPLFDDDIRTMSRACQRAGGINLAQGVGELPLLPEMAAAVHEAIDRGRNLYSPREGCAELREAIAARLRRDGISVDPATEVLVTSGAIAALSAAMTALLAPGDGVLLVEPFFTYQRVAASVARLEVQAVRTDPPAFVLDEARLRGALHPNTRALIVCTPSNPSGHILREEELDAIARVATERDLLVLSDEVYADYAFERPHRAVASQPRLRDRTITVHSFSKAFHVSGWRIGFAYGPERFIRSMTVAQNAHAGCAPMPLQLGAAAALEHGDAFLQAQRHSARARRDRLCTALREAGLPPYAPEGGCFLLAACREAPREAAAALLARTGVASVPANAFHADAPPAMLRFGFAVPDAVIDGAVSALARWPR